ncbi:uncharacterized protein PHACADRAFT_210623 [Phanerochaete carnosa HHB-10118-sp]|uniref:Uncharacterized protein n=1 Tax=Phanerochaete carnosa (strain HHB-10118-sp) TaxID=650164 RepID=K5WWM9_PHACS|nr:uncharacterized protein PHACADRAFT_210623 [Phanerochaete carnosa HHB-10118-sp]EKM54847.1 hypothetical protein PHACADRAFT_210623 [Phanerochaete carnosa HHB-10118-sp]
MGATTTVEEMLHTEGTSKFLRGLCQQCFVECSEPRTNARLLDQLIGKPIEPLCISLAFITGRQVSPVEAWAERLFEQRLRFEQQVTQKEQGDDEAQDINEMFADACVPSPAVSLQNPSLPLWLLVLETTVYGHLLTIDRRVSLLSKSRPGDPSPANRPAPDDRAAAAPGSNSTPSRPVPDCASAPIRPSYPRPSVADTRFLIDSHDLKIVVGLWQTIIHKGFYKDPLATKI